MPPVHHHHGFTLAAAFCFLAALGIATGIINSERFDAWLAGGLLALTLAQLRLRP